MDRRIDRWSTGALMVVLAVLVGGTALATWNTRRLHDDVSWLTHTQAVLAQLGVTRGHLAGAESAQRAYLITGDERYLERFTRERARAREDAERLADLTRDNPSHQSRVALLRQRVEERLALLDQGIRVRRDEGFEPAREFIRADVGRRKMLEVLELLDQYEAMENDLLGARAARAARRYRVALATEVLTGSLGVLLVGALGWLWARTLRGERRGTAAIHAERERLRITLASIGEGVIVADADGRIRYLNRVAESLTGWPLAEAVGRPLAECFRLFDEATGVEIDNPLHRIVAVGTVVGMANHAVLVARDGARRPIDDNAAPIRDPDGSPLGVVLVFHDVTERRLAEKEVEDARSFGQNLIDTVPEALLVLTPNREVVAANHSFHKMFSPDPKSLDSNALVFVGDPTGLAPPVRRLVDEVASHFLASGLRETERVVTSEDGRTFLATSRWLRTMGQPREHVLLALNDITSRVRAEAEIERLLARERDRSRRLRRLARASLTIHAARSEAVVKEVVVTEARLLLGATMAEIRPAASDSSVAEPSPAALAAPLLGRDSAPLGYLFVQRGPEDPFSDDDRFMLDQLSLIAAVAIINARSLEELAARDRRKDEFLATLAHEIRNPMAPIRSALELWRRGARDPDVAANSHAIIERQVRHMARLVDDLLDLSRIKHGRIELRRATIALGDVIAAALETCAPLLEKKEDEVTVSLPPETVYLDGDAARLAQVFANILSNAAKYSPVGARIDLSAKRDGPDILVAISDSGVGIAPDQLGRVFDMFTRIEPAHYQPQEGLGVGLSLARGLVELHGGTIAAHSEGLGRGSTFVVRLPVTRDTPRAAPAERPAPPTASTPRRVLVVDDNADAAECLAALLRLAGHEARVAFDGLAALEAADLFHPEVVVLDIGLPGMDGYEVARRLRSRPGGEPLLLIAVTGWGLEGDRAQSRQAGFDHHLVKPVDPEALDRLLESHLATP